MRPPDATTRAGRDPGPRLHTKAFVLVVAGVLVAACQPLQAEGPLPAVDSTVPPTSTTTTTSAVPPSTTTTTEPSRAVAGPPLESPYAVPSTEVAPEAKQLAVELVQLLTNYEETTDHNGRLAGLFAGSELGPEVLQPLIHEGFWSRGEVIYPQLGGLTTDKASVMVVTRQTVGRGNEADWSVLRTIDVRLVRDEARWTFDHLASAGGSFETIEDLSLAHAVASDPRIDMPDSARLDILSGLMSPTLLEVMAQLADRTPYAVTVLATGHPHNVFETDRQSHHTVGKAVDIYRIGTELVIDGRHDAESATAVAMQWMYEHPDVVQVGGPWDLDGPGSKRSFTNEVHQDHLHLAVRD